MTAIWKLTTKLIVLVAFAGAASAQPASTAADPAPAAAAQPPGMPPAAPSAARQACSAAMNADPAFAKEIVRVADEQAAKQRDDDTLAAHNDAVKRVQQNQAHVIWAYAAIWIVAAVFVVFLWRRQQGLQREIANLRRDLEAAATDAKVTT
jgi:CcmD family protein